MLTFLPSGVLFILIYLVWSHIWIQSLCFSTVCVKPNRLWGYGSTSGGFSLVGAPPCQQDLKLLPPARQTDIRIRLLSELFSSWICLPNNAKYDGFIPGWWGLTLVSFFGVVMDVRFQIKDFCYYCILLTVAFCWWSITFISVHSLSEQLCHHLLLETSVVVEERSSGLKSCAARKPNVSQSSRFSHFSNNIGGSTLIQYRPQ